MKSTGRFTVELQKLMARSYDICQLCNSKLPKEIAAFAGYDKNEKPIYVGECCKSNINELATHVYWWWEVDKRVNPSTRLWRYMDFAKFAAMLETRSLYFARADVLGDPFEGASGTVERQSHWNDFYLDFFRQAILTAPGQKKKIDPDFVEQEAMRLLKDFSSSAKRDRLCTFVSCWHANTGESEALWRLYCPPQTVGVAIETTAENLVQSLGDKSDIKIGKVQYVDFRKTYAGIHDRIYYKRKSLSHESEVRAVIHQHHQQEDKGISIPAHLETLLLSIVPSPFSPPWFKALLESILARYRVKIRIKPSELISEPFF